MPSKRVRKKPEPEDPKPKDDSEPPTKKKRGQKDKKSTDVESTTDAATTTSSTEASKSPLKSTKRQLKKTAKETEGTDGETAVEEEKGKRQLRTGRGKHNERQPTTVKERQTKKSTKTTTQKKPSTKTDSSKVVKPKKTRNDEGMTTESERNTDLPKTKPVPHKTGTVRGKKKPNQEKVVANSGIETKVSHPSHKTIAGTVLVLGMGELGQLGLGEDTVEKKRPFPVKGPIENKVVQVVCGGVHTVALTDDGQIYTWGCNDEGALGRSIDDIDEFTPGLVESLKEVKVVQLSAGDSHTAALTENGFVYCWGIFRDSDGPFGLINSSPSMEPELMYSSAFNKAIKIVSGAHHVALLTEQGDIYTFGCGENGQLGRVSECFSVRGGRRGIGLLLAPQIVHFRFPKRSSNSFRDIYAGEHSTFAVGKGDKEVYAWGLNHRGQLGIGDETTRFVPEKLPKDWLWCWTKKDSNSSSLSIAGGSAHSVVCDSGGVYVMGANEYGQLGLPKTVTQVDTPTEIKGICDVESVACGTRCSFAVTGKGEVLAWGIGSNYQLGCGKDEEDLFVPTSMQGKNLDNCKVLDASSGGQHTALLVSMDTN